MTKASSALINVSVSIVSLVFILLLVEGGLRLSGYHGMNINFRPVKYSDEYGWELKPNYSGIWEALEWKVNYRTNSQGFRDLDRKEKKNSGVKRVVVLGDSQAEGWGVEFIEMWQTKLQEKLGSQYEILNFGVRGYDVIQEYKLFLNEVLEYEPDYVIQILDPNDWSGLSESIMGEDVRFRPSYALKEGKVEFGSAENKVIKNISKNALVHSLKSILYRSAVIVWIKTGISNTRMLDYLLIGLKLRKEMPISAKTKKVASDYDLNYKNAVSIIYRNMAVLEKEWNFEFIVVYRSNQIPGELDELISAHHHLILAKLDKQETWKYDGHPNGPGNTKIANDIYDYFVHKFISPNLGPLIEGRVPKED